MFVCFFCRCIFNLLLYLVVLGVLVIWIWVLLRIVCGELLFVLDSDLLRLILIELVVFIGMLVEFRMIWLFIRCIWDELLILMLSWKVVFCVFSNDVFSSWIESVLVLFWLIIVCVMYRVEFMVWMCCVLLLSIFSCELLCNV